MVNHEGAKFALLALLAVFIVLPAAHAQPSKLKGSCVCPALYKPVCGVNGVTYSNACVAGCAKVKVAYVGACGGKGLGSARKLAQTKSLLIKSCICTDLYDPVCGVNGVTYGNACQASCAKVAIKCKGSCESQCNTVRRQLKQTKRAFVPSPEPCTCPDVYDPVCTTNGITFGNACQAACAKMPVACQGSCDTQCNTMRRHLKQLPKRILPGKCVCTTGIKPVCGVDGNTYNNDCLAACAGVAVAYKGACAVRKLRQVTGAYGAGAAGRTLQQLVLASGTAPSKGNTANARKLLQSTITRVIPPQGCFCPQIYAPVCGADGRTYGNACEANCAKVAVVSQGECPAACPCTKEYNPQCGSDGKTYANPCLAKCAGVTYTAGACLPSIQCGPSDPGARCLVDPCGLPSPCKGRPNVICSSNYCGLPVEFLGVTLTTPCTAVYVDITTQTIVPNCDGPAPPPEDPCASISTAYAPVCGADDKTYHNSASATCQGVAVARTGACPACPTTNPPCGSTLSPVCATDGVTYCNLCTARALKKTLLYRGYCPAPKCMREGSVCLLANPQCCSGMTCNGGPVLREGQVFGTCVVGPGPRG